MGTSRVKYTITNEAADHADARAAELGCSSVSTLIEALLRADMQRPVEGLAARVGEVEKKLYARKSTAGQANAEKSRERRWPGRSDKDPA